MSKYRVDIKFIIDTGFLKGYINIWAKARKGIEAKAKKRVCDKFRRDGIRLYSLQIEKVTKIK